MPNLAQAISKALETHAARRKLSVGLIYTGNRPVAEQLIASGHRLVVVSDRFHPLLKLFENMRQEEGRGADARVLMVEARLPALPIGRESLDALVLSNGMPLKSPPLQALFSLRALLKPDGLLIWPQPIGGGLRGVFSRKSVTRRGALGLTRREAFTRLVMEAGFYEVGQVLIPKAMSKVVITTGRPRGGVPWQDQSAPGV